MHPNKQKIKIICELSHQHSGDLNKLETMIMQSKMGGADFVKVQLFSSQDLFGDDRKRHLEITGEEFVHLCEFSKNLGIEMFASIFDTKKLILCENIRMKYYKIASRTFSNQELCKEIISKNKTTFISNGLNPYNFKYSAHNVIHFYCKPEYPTHLENIHLPKQFSMEGYYGYSDHCIGLTPAKVAVTRGAKYIEKHFTLSKNLQSENERGHLGAMDFNDLVELRRFCDEFVQIPS